MVETAQDLIWRVDENGRFTYLNPVWEEKIGFKLEEMLGRPFTDFKNPEEGARSTELYNQIMAGGVLTEYLTTYTSKSGQELILNFKAKPIYDSLGNVVGTQGTAQDFTERIKAEEILRASERLLQIVFDTFPLWVMIKDRELKYLRVNAAFATFFGKPQAEFIGETSVTLGIGTEEETSVIVEAQS